jgi:hypothetical protein
MKNPFKRKSEKFPKTSAPRSLDDIKKAYNEAVFTVGQLQYRQYVNTKDLEQANKVLLSLNHEAAERNKLDKEVAAAAPKPLVETPATEVANEQG